MTRDEIGQVAACRGELVVQITEGGRDRWLLCSQLPCSLAELAGSLSSDAYEAWRAGEMVVTDKDGKVLVDNFTDDWRRREPLHFVRPGRDCPRCGSDTRACEHWCQGCDKVCGEVGTCTNGFCEACCAAKCEEAT